MERFEEIPDRRYWTAYDHFMVECEARAMRRRYVAQLVSQALRRMQARLQRAFAHAGAQPPRRARTQGG